MSITTTNHSPKLAFICQQAAAAKTMDIEAEPIIITICAWHQQGFVAPAGVKVNHTICATCTELIEEAERTRKALEASRLAVVEAGRAKARLAADYDSYNEWCQGEGIDPQYKTMEAFNDAI